MDWLSGESNRDEQAGTARVRKRRLSRRDAVRLAGIGGLAAQLLADRGAAAVPALNSISAMPSAAEAGSLTFATSSPWDARLPFKPVLASYGYDSNIPAFLTHSRLVSRAGESSLQPDLAETWEVSTDATTYTYHLRQDATFHDGAPVTAKDVAATVRLYLTKAANVNPLYWIDHLKGAKEFYEGTSTELPGMRLPDDYTISFELNEPFASWDAFSIHEMNILPAHIYESVDPASLAEEYSPEWFKPELQIGSGPFKFVSAERDQFIELARHDAYFGGRPKLGRILFRNFGAVDTQAIAFENGEIDVWNVPPDYADRIRGLANVTMHEIKRRYIRVFAINYRQPYLADKRVRQALLYGINRQALIDELMGGLGEPWNSFVESESWLAQGLNPYAYEPERARQLLSEAGWDPGQTLEILYYYNDTFHRDWFAAIQQQLAEIGVKASVQLLEGTVIDERATDCDFDILYQGWGFNATSPAVYGPIFTCARGCPGIWCNKEVEELFRLGKTTVDEAKQHEIYDQIQRMVNEELPLLPMIKFVGLTATQARVTGFDEDALWMMHHPWNSSANGAVNWAVSD